MAYRFVHAADVHLDSPLRSLALRSPDLAALIGNATRHAFVRIIDLCLDEQVDALLLAGDLYDGDQTSMKTARFLAQQLHRLHEAGIRVFIIRGNHDALSRITKELTFPEGTVKIFGGRAEAVHATGPGAALPVVIHGLSFAQPHAPESLVSRYRAPVADAVNIGLMHSSLAGAPGHDRYAPCSVADLQSAGYRYWALGHIHKRSVLEGVCTIVMPGMPQGRDINEAGAKSVTLVTVGDDGSIQLRECVTAVAQFERAEADLTGIEDWRDAVSAIAKTLRSTRDATASGVLVARLRLTGDTKLGWRVRRDLDQLRAEADQCGAVIGDCWIEKIEVECAAPGVGSGTGADPAAELRRLMADEVLQSNAYREQVAALVDHMRSQLPPECRDLFGPDEAAARSVTEQLARDGMQDILARLYGVARAEGG